MYASSFSLMNSSLAAASVCGPLFYGWLEERFGWEASTVAMGALCLSGALPCVSVYVFRSICGGSANLYWVRLFLPVGEV